MAVHEVGACLAQRGEHLKARVHAAWREHAAGLKAQVAQVILINLFMFGRACLLLCVLLAVISCVLNCGSAVGMVDDAAWR